MRNFTPRNKLIIDLVNYEKNLQLVKEKLKHQEIIAVIKANAYGMGYEKVLTILKRNGIRKVAISCLQEAIEVRNIFKSEISLLGDFLSDEVPLLLENDVIIPITSLEKAELVSEVAKTRGVKAKVQVYVDTGMGNLGIFHGLASEQIREICSLEWLKVEEIFTHFAWADNPSNDFTREQVKRFDEVLDPLSDLIQEKNIKLHISNSDGVTFFPELTRSRRYHYARLGVMLFGTSKKQIEYGLKPCLSFKSQLIAIKKISPPYSIGYSKTYELKESTWVGTISAGYADGVPFALSNRGRVIIRGESYPIIGRLSMDYLTIDLKGNKANLPLGEAVTLLGRDDESQESILVEEWSKYKSTHDYEILCSFGSRRLDKIYIE